MGDALIPLTGWSTTLPARVKGVEGGRPISSHRWKSYLALRNVSWHIFEYQIDDCCPRWICQKRTSCTCSHQSCQLLLQALKSEKGFLKESLVYLYLYFQNKHFCLFPPAILAVQLTQTINWRLLMSTREERWRFNHLRRDLTIFLSRCITWPFPGVTQWTKLRETLPLWQASLYSDRCNT